MKSEAELDLFDSQLLNATLNSQTAGARGVVGTQR